MNQKAYKVNVVYPSGLHQVVTVSPGTTRVVVDRAVDDNGVPLIVCTVEPNDEGGYVCHETGHTLRVKRYLLPLILDMERACNYIKMTGKNILSPFCAEWPAEVTPVKEFFIGMEGGQQLSEEGTFVDSGIGILSRLSDDPGKLKAPEQKIII